MFVLASLLSARRYGSDRLKALYSSENNVVARILRGAKSVSIEDVRSLAALECGMNCGSLVHGSESTNFEVLLLAAGLSLKEYWGLFMTVHPLCVKQISSDALVLQIVTQSLTLLRDHSKYELAPLEIAGALQALVPLFSKRPKVIKHAFENGVYDIIMCSIRACGDHPKDYLRGEYSSIADSAIRVAYNHIRVPDAELTAQIKAAWLSSGFVSELVAILRAYEEQGVDSVQDTSTNLIFGVTNALKYVAAEPSCRELLRGAVPALQFTAKYDKLLFPSSGHTSAASCLMICASVFGREEGDSFEFTQSHVDSMYVSRSIYEA